MEQWNAHQALEQETRSLSENDIVVLERYRLFRQSTMPGASAQKQFDAAVNLIRGLPKDGPFQPSNDMKLRLYGFFKQATEGPCTQPAPSFWDVIGKAKWGAWKSLADMPAEEAMTSYVEEIKKVMETMSLTDDVANLMDTLGPVYEYVDEEKVERPARKKHVRFSADEEAPATNGHVTAEPASVNGHVTPAAPGQNGLYSSPPVNGNGELEPELEQEQEQEQEQEPPQEPEPQREQERWVGSATSDTDDDEEFNDPIGDPELAAERRDATQARLDALHHQVQTLTQLMDSAGAQMLGGRLETACSAPAAETTVKQRLVGGATSCPGLHDELRALVRDMRDDLDTITGRLRCLEAAHSHRAAATQHDKVERPWWQVPELSARSVLLLLAWPLVLQLALRLITSRRRR